MQWITYRGEHVALAVNGDLAVFHPELEARGWEDPVLRFAAAMCRFAMEIELGLEPGPYDDERAEGFAREVLMPADCFAALAALPDPYRPPASACRPSRCRCGARNSASRSSTAGRTPARLAGP